MCPRRLFGFGLKERRFLSPFGAAVEEDELRLLAELVILQCIQFVQRIRVQGRLGYSPDHRSRPEKEIHDTDNSLTTISVPGSQVEVPETRQNVQKTCQGRALDPLLVRLDTTSLQATDGLLLVGRDVGAGRSSEKNQDTEKQVAHCVSFI